MANNVPSTNEIHVTTSVAPEHISAPTVGPYSDVGRSVEVPIRRALNYSIQRSNEFVKQVNEYFSDHFSTPIGENYLDDLIKHHENLSKVLSELQVLPEYVESKLNLFFLQKDQTAEAVSQEMRKLLDEQELSRKISDVQEMIKMIEEELSSKGRTICSKELEYDPIQEFFLLTKNLDNENEINEETLLKNSEEQLEFEQRKKAQVDQIASNELSSTALAEPPAAPLKSNYPCLLPELQKSFQALEQKNAVRLSQLMGAAVEKLSGELSKILYRSDKQKQERELRFEKDEVGNNLEDAAEHYMVSSSTNKRYQYPRNFQSTPQKFQGCSNVPQDESSIPLGGRFNERSYYHEPLYNQSQNFRNFDRYEQKLISFDGTGQLNLFRRVFYRNVVENPELTDDEKYIELSRCLVGPAARCLQTMENTAIALNETFYELEQVYGTKVDRMVLHEKLVSLPFHQTDYQQMIHDLQAHRSLINQLKEKRLNVDDERTIAPFCQKLPEFILNDIMPIMKLDSDKLTFAMVHDAVAESIRTKKRKETLLGRRPVRGLNEISSVYMAGQQAPYPTVFNNIYQAQNQNIQPQNQNPRYNNSYQNQWNMNYQGTQRNGIFRSEEEQ